MFRKTLFWIHLATGLIAGLVIAIMSFTGAVLAFEHEIVDWAERDVRTIAVPAAATPLPIDDLLTRVREAAPSGARPAGVTISRDPADALAVSYGGVGTYYVNPYTGEVRPPAPTRTHDFMHLMEDCHRRLAFTGDRRETGRAITGACNAAFLLLAVTGFYLWWPRQWTWRLLRPSFRFVGASGKARDWNWHNVAGFWSLPVIIVMASTGLVISYRWAGNLAYQAVGEPPPAPPAAPAEEPKVDRPEDARRLTYGAALAAIQKQFPTWQTITWREGLPRRRGAPLPRQSPQSGDGQPYSATVNATDGSPAFVATQLVLNPFTGELLSRSGYAEQTSGRKIRSWLRFLHTGQALGWPGQFLAALACVGGLILVYSGFALSFRRFFPSRIKP